MAALPTILVDPTLEAVNAAYQGMAAAEKARPYLGMSGIGHPCLRKHWYDFHWCSSPDFDAATLYRFADGHLSEDIMADRLRLVEGVKLQTIEPETNRQIGFVDLGGHFRGHADGIIHGLLQAPRTGHIWEHKCVNEAKFRKLIKLVSECGEKGAFEAWDTTYYVQGQLYMHYSGLKRHYLTCATPGTRDATSVRTNYDRSVADEHIERARRVIQSDIPLERVSDNPSFWQCKWCNHADLCHGNRVANVNCRTCLHSEPVDGGNWNCRKLNRHISVDVQRSSGDDERPCPHHRLIPQLVPFAEVTDASEAGNWVEYQTKDGGIFANGSGDLQFTSLDIRRAGVLIVDPVVTEIKKPSAGVSETSAKNQSDTQNPWSTAEDAGTLWLTGLGTGQESESAK